MSQRDFKIVKFELTPTGTYNPQYRRPYKSNLTAESLAAIKEAIAGKTNIVAGALAGVVSQFLQVSRAPESDLGGLGDPKEVTIPHGWDAPRWRYELVIESVDRTGLLSLRQFIMGYTDHMRPTLEGKPFDPAIRFFINSITTTRSFLQSTPTGMKENVSVINAAQVMANHGYSGYQGKERLFMMRPENVFDQIDTQRLLGLVDERQVIDARSILTGNVTMSNYKNAIAPVFMAESLDAYLQCSRNESYTGSTESYVLDSARATVESEPVSSDPFLVFLRDLEGNQSNGTFLLQDLKQIDPAIEPTLLRLEEEPHAAGETSDWGGSSLNTVWAATLCQAVPAYLAQHGLKRFVFSAGNLNMPTEHAVFPVTAKTVTGDTPSHETVLALTSQMREELFKHLSQNGMISYQLTMACDVTGDTRFRLMVENDFQYWCAPTFASALTSPVVTADKMTLDSLAHDVDAVIIEIGESIEEAAANRGIAD